MTQNQKFFIEMGNTLLGAGATAEVVADVLADRFHKFDRITFMQQVTGGEVIDSEDAIYLTVNGRAYNVANGDEAKHIIDTKDNPF